MFIRAEGIIQKMRIGVSASASDKAAKPVRGWALSKKHIAPLNHLEHNRGACTFHNCLQRDAWSKVQLNTLQQMKTSHSVIDCAVQRSDSPDRKPRQRCSRASHSCHKEPDKSLYFGLENFPSSQLQSAVASNI